MQVSLNISFFFARDHPIELILDLDDVNTLLPMALNIPCEFHLNCHCQRACELHVTRSMSRDRAQSWLQRVWRFLVLRTCTIDVGELVNSLRRRTSNQRVCKYLIPNQTAVKTSPVASAQRKETNKRKAVQKSAFLLQLPLDLRHPPCGSVISPLCRSRGSIGSLGVEESNKSDSPCERESSQARASILGRQQPFVCSACIWQQNQPQSLAGQTFLKDMAQ